MSLSTTKRVPAPDWRKLAGLFALSLVLRGLMLAYRLVSLQTPTNLLGGSDVPGWLGMASHFYYVSPFDFSYYLLGARPPFYPMVLAGVYAIGGSQVHAAVLQVVFSAATVLLGYLLARRLLYQTELPSPEKLALIAGLVMACDPASVSTAATLLSEPLFNLLFTACLLSLTAFIQEERWRDLAPTAVWLALSMLTRPTAIYFWVVAPLMLIPFVKRWWRPALVLAVTGLVVYFSWTVVVWQNRGIFTYSTNGSFNLLFLRALSAEHLATGALTDDIQVEYVRTVYQNTGNDEAAALAVPEHFWRFMVPETPEEYAEVNRLAREKLIQYWPYALLGTGVGAWRMFALTTSLPHWFRPVELIYHLFLYGLMVWGGWQAFRRKDWQVMILTGLPILYMTGLTLVSQTSAMDSRMRTGISVPIIILAAYGLGCVIRTVRVREAAG